MNGRPGIIPSKIEAQRLQHRPQLGFRRLAQQLGQKVMETDSSSPVVLAGAAIALSDMPSVKWSKQSNDPALG
jgi:hypothetical protein